MPSKMTFFQKMSKKREIIVQQKISALAVPPCSLIPAPISKWAICIKFSLYINFYGYFADIRETDRSLSFGKGEFP
jgi:hypothetical protein